MFLPWHLYPGLLEAAAAWHVVRGRGLAAINGRLGHIFNRRLSTATLARGWPVFLQARKCKVQRDQAFLQVANTWSLCIVVEAEGLLFASLVCSDPVSPNRVLLK